MACQAKNLVSDFGGPPLGVGSPYKAKIVPAIVRLSDATSTTFVVHSRCDVVSFCQTAR
jgi:hypothetical protein